jgi:glycosyltransferase involved in cell wall biosynthesis
MTSSRCGILVNVEQRFVRTPDGTVWTDGPFPYSFWRRYLEVFDDVRVVARVRDVAAVAASAQPIVGPSVEVVALPHYVGALPALTTLPAVRRVIKAALTTPSAVILRIPSLIACTIASYLRRARRPYSVEVVADAYDVFAPGAIDHVLRPVVRNWMTRQQREQCRYAAAAAYVTKSALQQRYPCGGFAIGVSDVQLGEGTFGEPFSTHYSSVQLDDAAFASSPQKTATATVDRIITVGSLEHPYKGTDLLIEALATILKRRANVELVVIGDGRHRPALERQAAALGISQSVQFRGHVSSVLDVRRELNAATLFVLPSRTEGLPRAMVEAMARGLACIGSAVGGIPELLDSADLVPPGNVAALSEKILLVLSSPARLKQMGDRNLKVAAEYRDEVLRERRLGFYRHVRAMTTKILCDDPGPSRLSFVS